MYFERHDEHGYRRAVAAVLLLLVFLCVGGVPAQNTTTKETLPVPVLKLDGGRRLEFIRAISSQDQIEPNRSVWNRLVDWVAGPPEYRAMLRPYGVTLDSRGRMLVTDPGSALVHILDFERQKFDSLKPGKGRAFQSPMGVAVDAADNIYVSDSQQAAVLIFSAAGKFLRVIDGHATGDQLFLRPTGLAIDAAQNRLFVVDTLRHCVNVLDLQGRLLQRFGQRGLADGNFNFPTEIVVRDGNVMVVDAMNFRIQTFTRDGRFLRSFGALGERAGSLLRPKGLALDSAGNIYVADGLLEIVQVFDPAGRLLYYFGGSGRALGEFQMPAGIHVDARNRIYVADSLNRRVQIFQFRGPATNSAAGGGGE